MNYGLIINGINSLRNLLLKASETFFMKKKTRKSAQAPEIKARKRERESLIHQIMLLILIHVEMSFTFKKFLSSFSGFFFRENVFISMSGKCFFTDTWQNRIIYQQ